MRSDATVREHSETRTRIILFLTQPHCYTFSHRYAVFANTSNAAEVSPWHTQFDGVSGSRV